MSECCPASHSPRARWLASLAALVLVSGALVLGQAPPAGSPQGEPAARWWKGNLHTHSLWSDGDQYPEMIAAWYKEHGYHFLALSDHNVLAQGAKWIDAEKNKGKLAALEKYRARFGASWVEERMAVPEPEKEEPKKADAKQTETKEAEPVGPRRQVRLKPFDEYRSLFDEPDRFLMVQGEEVSDKFGKLPLHLCVTNLRDVIPPQGGESVADTLSNDIRAAHEQRRATGRPILPHINHPNFGYAITAEDLAQVEGDRFFEIYNGHRGVKNEGDATHVDVERMWDIVLTLRLAEFKTGLVYGLATDDSHDYHGDKPTSMPGRGWIVVRARRLTPASLIAAMEAGDFYSSTGVSLRDIRMADGKLRIEIEPEPGVTYTTQFIGTRQGYDKTTQPVLDKEGAPLPVTRKYSADIGQVLAEQQGPVAEYKLQGDELYVRAKVTSSKAKENWYRQGERESAWVQPVTPTAKKGD